MDSLYITQSIWGNWFAAGVFDIKMVPGRLPSQFIPLILSACEMEDISLECVCASHETEAHRVSMRLIVRKTGANPRLLAEELPAAMETLNTHFQRAGIQTDTLNTRACYDLSQKMLERKQLTLCFAGENLRISCGSYIPGGIDAVLPLDISALFQILSESRGIGISLQVIPTMAYPREKEAISRMLNTLSSSVPVSGIQQAQQIYGAWADQMDQPLFFYTLHFWGENDALNQLMLRLRYSRFMTMEIPQDLWDKADYLCQGGELLSGFVAAMAHVLPEETGVPDGLHRLSHLASPQQIAALLTRNCTGALPGIQVNRIPEIQTYLPPTLSMEKGIKIGVLAGDASQKVCISPDKFSKHAVVVGMPGTGKTTFSFGLLHSLYTQGIPFLAVEPTKTEYRELMDAIPELQIYTPGRADVSPLMFNPFLPPAGVTLEQYLPSLETAFSTAFSMTRPLDVIFPEVLRSCYTRYGWRMSSTRDSAQAKPFGMQEFIRAFRDEIDNSGYDADSRANLQSGGVYRFQSLLNSNSVLFDTDQPLPTDDLLKKPTLIELDAIDNAEQKSLILSLLLIQLKLLIRRDQIADGKLKNVIMIDEAHLLLGQAAKHLEANEADPTGKTVAFLQDMVLVNRAYGTGMIFADQSPHKLTKEIVANADIQLIFRLNSADDRRMLADNMNMPPALVQMIEALPTGQCCLHCGDLESPVRVITPNVREELKLRHQVQDHEVRQRMAGKERVPFQTCACGGKCDISVRQEAEYMARLFCDRARPYFQDREKLNAYLKEHIQKYLKETVSSHAQKEKLYSCAQMMIMRKILSQASCLSGQQPENQS